MGTWLFEPGHTAAMFRARHKRGAKALQQAPSLRVGEAPNWTGATKTCCGRSGRPVKSGHGICLPQCLSVRDELGGIWWS
jgi:hypothetical protein